MEDGVLRLVDMRYREIVTLTPEYADLAVKTAPLHDVGKIRVSEADCPDKTCVRMGWLNSAAMPVVCLPHHLVIGFADGGEGGVDAVAE